MSESYRPRRGRPSGRGPRAGHPDYTARRALVASAAVLLVVLIAGGSVLAVGSVGRLLGGRAGRTAPAVPTLKAATGPTPAPSAVATPPASTASTGSRASAATPSATATITIAAVGDMMFGRGVSDYIRANGGAAILSRVAPLLSRADVTLGNLEGPLARTGSAAQGKDVTLLGNPAAIAGLRMAGFDAVGLANNHALDYGAPALKNTLSLLDRAGIAHSGAGMNRASAWRPAIVEVNGTRVALLSFSHILPAGFIATDSRAGIARSKDRMDQVVQAIRAAKRTNDVVVVSFHWGVEYTPDANDDQRRDARRAIDAGADLVVSEHPHVIQGLEAYKGRLIAYSLGDFVFDHYSRETGESFILLAKVGRGGVAGARIVPTYLGSGNGRPAIVDGAAAQRILKRLRTISKRLGTTVVIKGDEATVEMK